MPAASSTRRRSSDGTTAIFSFDEEAALDKLSQWLRGQGWGRGWAKPLTVQGLLDDWQHLSIEVDRYAMTIDDYTNDLTARDGLEIILARCEEPLRTKLRLVIAEADSNFLARTQDDTGQTLTRYFRVDQSSGWWWRRRPAAGPLAEYLTGA